MGYQDDYVMRTISDLVRKTGTWKKRDQLCPSGYRG